MHPCNTVCSAAPTPSPFLHDFLQLNVAEINSGADFASMQRRLDNAQVIVRVDSPMLPCTDVAAHELAPVFNMQAQGQMLPSLTPMRLCIHAEEDEEMQPCISAHSLVQEEAHTAAYIDESVHTQAMRCSEHGVDYLNMPRADQYSTAQEAEVNGRWVQHTLTECIGSAGARAMQSCLPPMSSTLIESIESARVQASRCKRMWTIMQLTSTVSQIMGVILVLVVCSKEEDVVVTRRVQDTLSSACPLRAWALGYALGCLASLPLFCKRTQHSDTGSHDRVGMDDNGGTHDRRGGRGGGGGGEEEEEQERRLRRGLDIFFGIWFVLGVVWVFGRPSCALGSPNLYSLCVTLLMLSGLRYMMFLLLCCALCCCLRPTTSRMSFGFNQEDGGEKGATQDHIDATLPIFKFKHRWPIADTILHNKTFSIPTPTIIEKCICKDVMESCCICLKRYKEDAKLRGLPCSHYFHVDCADKWLKLNASCPLCKFSIKDARAPPFHFF